VAYSRWVKEYYERFAPAYDRWYRGLYYEGTEREGFLAEVATLCHVLETLPPARTLDVACGTGFLTAHLRGEVTGLDASSSMLSQAEEQAPHATFVVGEALALPFEDGSFDRVFSGHFYGHLEEQERLRFLSEARRVAPELVLVDAPVRPDHDAEEWQVRRTDDGAEWQLYKRFFAPEVLLDEVGGGDVLLDGEWFVVIASR
jgi:ubiquinone/menaquinone biosynthesis C-methylase UbiE